MQAAQSKHPFEVELLVSREHICQSGPHTGNALWCMLDNGVCLGGMPQTSQVYINWTRHKSANQCVDC